MVIRIFGQFSRIIFFNTQIKTMNSKNTQNKQTDVDIAIFAGGCFWGVEYYMKKAHGVKSVAVGYIGGDLENPTYENVCSSTTGHAEAIRINFDPSQTNYEKLAKLFFEVHDPGQTNGQGPDIGEQYRSEIFYIGEEQKETAKKLIKELKQKGVNVVTKLTAASTFYLAENYHQNYYEKTGGTPYCHTYKKRF